MTELSETPVPIRFAAVPAARADVLHRAMARARAAGASALVAGVETVEQALRDADVLVSLPWPAGAGMQTAALAAMTARIPVIVLESTHTAEWPALDPQTWAPRGFGGDAPIVVSLDPRDEEHSLVLAIRRLSIDPALRSRLADAAYAWRERQQV